MYSSERLQQTELLRGNHKAENKGKERRRRGEQWVENQIKERGARITLPSILYQSCSMSTVGITSLK